jgi:hypothetical protein
LDILSIEKLVKTVSNKWHAMINKKKYKNQKYTNKQTKTYKNNKQQKKKKTI